MYFRNIFSLPLLTNKGEKIVYCGLQNLEPVSFKMVPAMKVFTMAIEATLMADGLYPGYVVILDAANLSIRHMPLSAIPTIKKFLYFVQVRGGSVNFLNPTNQFFFFLNSLVNL